MKKPTPKTYDNLQSAYDKFNDQLFSGELPPCLITMQRQASTLGYFAPKRFGDDKTITDEIALNPTFFREKGSEKTLSTLVHEMVHLWQHHCGKPSRTGYHNKEWANKMRSVGLIASDTGEPGGREVGQRMTHYIEAGGRFQAVFKTLNFEPLYSDLWSENETQKKAAKAKAKSKTRYCCPLCGLNAWAKPDVRIICADCDVLLEADETDET